MEMEPITRREMFMAKAGGQDVNTPTPITREEMFLSRIGGSGGDYAPLIVYITDNGDGTYTADKTFEEVVEVYAAGREVFYELDATRHSVEFADADVGLVQAQNVAVNQSANNLISKQILHMRVATGVYTVMVNTKAFTLTPKE